MLRGSQAALQHLTSHHGHRLMLPVACSGKTAISYRSAVTVASPPAPPVSTPAPNPAKHTISFGDYWETSPPSSSQLRDAERFFNRAPPELLYSTTDFRTIKISAVPEVAFLGRSNVGKSSLLNRVMGRKICYTSRKPGRTRTMNFFAVGGEDGAGNPGKLVVLDMPGYGKGSRAEWGKEIMKYLVGRRQLKRAFLLIDSQHGLKTSDEELLRLLRENGISHQVILSKADKIVYRGSKNLSKHQLQNNTQNLKKICEGLREKVQPVGCEYPVALGELIACSAEKSVEGERIGINNLRWAVLTAAGLNDLRKKTPVLQLPVKDIELDKVHHNIVPD